jgi:hypothetical protein
MVWLDAAPSRAFHSRRAAIGRCEEAHRESHAGEIRHRPARGCTKINKLHGARLTSRRGCCTWGRAVRDGVPGVFVDRFVSKIIQRRVMVTPTARVSTTQRSVTWWAAWGSNPEPAD